MTRRAEKVTFTVTFDPGTSRWNIARNGAATGGFAYQMATAIGSAYREASLEQAGTGKDVTVWSIDATGKRRKEWPTD
jgi:hypothetical protein